LAAPPVARQPPDGIAPRRALLDAEIAVLTGARGLHRRHLDSDVVGLLRVHAALSTHS
jgi:hypothetical protein